MYSVSLGVLHKCVISTPNGWSLTRLPNLSCTHLLIIAEVENQSHVLQLVLPKTSLQTFVERLCPSLSTKGCWEAVSVGIITRTWMRTWKILFSCGRSRLKWSAPPFSTRIGIANISLGCVSFFSGGRHNSTTASQRLGRTTEGLKA